MTYDCPDCDSKKFIQEVVEAEVVHVDDGGTPEQFENAGESVVKFIECENCGAEISGGEN